MKSISVYIFLIFILVINVLAVCKSSEYCPGGWNVLRKNDSTPHTCNIMAGITKCPKPYSCVHSKCGLDFCCSHTYKIDQYKKQQEIERDIKEAEMEDDEL